MKIRRILIGLLAFISLTVISRAQIPSESTSWNAWVADLRREAISEGIDPTLFDNMFTGLTPGKQQLQLHHSQPEKRLAYLQYRSTRISADRITIGRNKFNKNQLLLTNIGKDFGVDPCTVTAIWGIETSYGHYMGDFPVIRSLATLAYASPRYEFFRNELIEALRILQEGHVAPPDFKGEWAGASGMPQFLPSSWQKYAVDYDGNGTKNIWKDLPDALASIANYLKMNGWETGEPWGIQVNLPYGFDEEEANLKVVEPMSYWLQRGVEPVPGSHLPSGDPEASIIIPYGGPAFMVFNNFRVIMIYNNSTYYAASVAYLADQICRR